MSLVKTRFVHLFWVFFEKFGLVALSVFSFMIYAYYLTPEEMGLGILLLALVELCSLFLIAVVDNSIIRLKHITRSQDGTFFWFLTLFSSLLALLIYIAYLFYFEDARVQLIGLFAVCTLPLNVSVRLHIVHLRKQKKFKKLAHRTIVSKIVGMTAGIALAANSFGDFAIVIQTFTMALVSCVMLLAIEKRPLPFSFDKPFLLDQIRVGIPSSIKVMNGSFFMKGLVLGIEGTLGTAAVGVYNFAARLVDLPRSALLSALMGYANPVYANRNNQGKALESFFLDSTKFALLAIMPFFIGLSILAEPIVTLLFAEKWSPSIPILQGLAAIAAFNVLFMFLPSVLVAYGKTRLGLKGQIFASMMGLVTLALTIDGFGLHAIIISLMVRTVVSIITNYFVLKKVLVIPSFGFLKCCIAPILGSTIMALTLLLLQSTLLTEIHVLSVLLQVTIGFVVYVLTIFILNYKIISELKAFFRAKS